ncbi:MAG: hypothetical protein H8E46_08770 [FCB group bacterium]|nr:hypothetical protein [FCB group bacterium]
MNAFHDILIVAIIFGSIVYLLKTLSDNRIKRIALEKDQVNDNVKNLFQTKSNGGVNSAMKWGMVLIGIGLALLIGEFFAYDISEGGVVGLTFLFAGGALLLYYKLDRKKAASPPADSQE